MRYFLEHQADGVCDKLCLYFADHQIVHSSLDASILDNNQGLNAMLSQYDPLVQGELWEAIELYVHYKKQGIIDSIAFQALLCTHGLDEVWERLKRAQERKDSSLDLADMLQKCTPAVRSQVVESLVLFIQYHLPHVVNLELFGNGLTALPESFGNLMQLTELHLTGNHLPTLPTSCGNLTNLQIFDLSGNQLIVLPKSFENLTQLKVLNLANSQVD